MSDKHPHDRFFKVTFSNKNIVKGYLRNFLPKEIIRHLDFRTLKPANVSYVDKKLSEHLSDIVYNCTWRSQIPIQLSFLLEHQSTILKYQVNGWEYQLQQNAPLELIIPIIIYHGKRKWQYKSFPEYFNVRNVHLKQFIPNFEYVLTDLSQVSDEELMKLKLGFLVTSFLLLKHHHEKEYILQKAGEIFQYSIQFSEGGRIEETFYHIAFVYIAKAFKIKKPELDQIIESVPNQLKSTVMTAYDELIQEGFQKGIQKGEEKKEQEIIERLLIKKPHFSNEEIADLLNISVNEVLKIRQGLK